MIGWVLASMLVGPPKLPPLPSERRAAAAREEAARRAAEAEAEAEAEASPELDIPAVEGGGSESGPPETASPQGPPPGDPAAARKDPGSKPDRRGVRRSTPAALAGLADKQEPKPLAAASSEDVAIWAADDALYGRDPGGASTPSVEPPTPGDRPRTTSQPPTRTAVGLHTAARLEQPGRRRPPRRSAAFVFGYRLFQTHDAFTRPQSWHVGSVEVTPVRRFVRFNLITEFGAEGGPAARDGDRADIFLMQKAGLGVQYPHWLTPFVEFQGGAGVARVELFDRSDLVLLWTLGLDVGAQWAATRWMSIHASVGWIRPTFQRPERAVYHDSFTFKVGLGF